MNVNFLFMDESYSEAIDNKNTVISSLTGVLVPIHRYTEIRTKFYALLEWSIKPESNTINMSVPELHGRELLPKEDDAKKLEILEGVVELVVSNGLEIYRRGFYITKTTREYFKHDEEMLGLCWIDILHALKPKIENEMLIPVMDGLDKKKVLKFSQIVKSLDVMRAAGHEENLGIRHSENILGEVFYADSQYSIFTQVADLVSWLLQLSNIASEGKELTPYKKKFLLISEKLVPSIVCDEVKAMEFS